MTTGGVATIGVVKAGVVTVILLCWVEFGTFSELDVGAMVNEWEESVEVGVALGTLKHFIGFVFFRRLLLELPLGEADGEKPGNDEGFFVGLRPSLIFISSAVNLWSGHSLQQLEHTHTLLYTQPRNINCLYHRNCHDNKVQAE